MACPGAVSVSASKAVLSFSKSIVVDTSETAGLPALIKVRRMLNFGAELRHLFVRHDPLPTHKLEAKPGS